ncbi:head decoration protein [Pseudovibrio ascidiaceicola]|uniref:head decoration protein n=1 Tax=Pseudovibrio ascidiaceicola TaxID=285279 RepID=UPI003D364D1E
MTQFKEMPAKDGFLVSTGNGHISFDTGTLAGGQGYLKAGTLLAVSVNKFYKLDPGHATAARKVTKAILRDNVNTENGETECGLLARLAEVCEGDLVYPDGINEADQKKANEDLASELIIVRAE